MFVLFSLWPWRFGGNPAKKLKYRGGIVALCGHHQRQIIYSGSVWHARRAKCYHSSTPDVQNVN